jgi:hypothetical protein
MKPFLFRITCESLYSSGPQDDRSGAAVVGLIITLLYPICYCRYAGAMEPLIFFTLAFILAWGPGCTDSSCINLRFFFKGVSAMVGLEGVSVVSWGPSGVASLIDSAELSGNGCLFIFGSPSPFCAPDTE